MISLSGGKVMDKKMTSGEIAKIAGVSQKAVRLYDEKGLLKPSGYSEGNYRLYDESSLKILEKIVALKQIGFSLEEIRDNLIAGDASDVEEALRIQLKEMEDRRYQMDKVIAAISGTLERKEKKLDWDDVAEIVQTISLDQRADERHWDALKHTGSEPDWYVRIFDSLGLKGKERILDLGCGFSKLWRNNWSDIPEGSSIHAYDVHGSWADNFAEYLEENRAALPKGVNINLEFSDLEEAETWDKISEDKEYDVIIAHYLSYMLKDPEALIGRAAGVLSDKGYFSFGTVSRGSWHRFFGKALEAVGVKTDVINKKLDQLSEENQDCLDMLNRYFGRTESVVISNKWHYTEADEILDKMSEVVDDQNVMSPANRKKLLEYFGGLIGRDGEIVIEVESQFWHCFKR